MKKCTKCEQDKELTEFYTHIKFGPRPECKVCSKARNAENWKKNKVKIDKKAREWQAVNKNRLATYTRKQTLKRKYGLTIEAYEQMLIAQNNKCAICEEGSDKTFAVDHNHTTGKVRALLCGPCNVALGLLREDLKIVESVKKYLLEHNQ